MASKQSAFPAKTRPAVTPVKQPLNKVPASTKPGQTHVVPNANKLSDLAPGAASVIGKAIGNKAPAAPGALKQAAQGFLSKPPTMSQDKAPSVSRDAWRQDQFNKLKQGDGNSARQQARQKFLARKYGFNAPNKDVVGDKK
jgi:hypothetical protein